MSSPVRGCEFTDLLLVPIFFDNSDNSVWSLLGVKGLKGIHS